MGKIQKLETLTALQIAAGEVIDRPAAVVREILENSIDAGASQIKIELFNGGVQKIILTDNGCGIAKEDLELSVERHATSKIQKITDLNDLTTLGFRGEALASIAAVARLCITSKPIEQEVAWQIKTDGLNRHQSSPSSGLEGTRIEVEDLFYLTPARRKFLKKANTEYTKVDAIIKKISLANLSFNLVFSNDNKIVRKIPLATSLKDAKDRIAAILGHDFSDHLYFGESELPEIRKIQAWIAHPKFSRARSDLQFIVLNNRVIKDPAISNAIKRAFEDVMMIGRYPALVLYLTIDPSIIDFNVHPTKEQVKFQDPQLITRAIVKFLKQHIQEILSIKSSIHESLMQETPSMDFQNIQSMSPTKVSRPQENISYNQLSPKPEESTHDMLGNTYQATSYKSPFVELSSPKPPLPQVSNNLDDSQNSFSLGVAIYHLSNRYILSETKDGLIVVDAHAAHERIVYERMKLEYNDQGVACQNLILPITIQLDDIQIKHCLEYQIIFEQFGFSFTLDQSILSITGIPKVLGEINSEELFIDVLTEVIQDSESHLINQKVDKILATLACHRSVRSMRELSIQEMNELLRQIESTDLANVCNHGRPTWIKMDLKQIDHLFHRT